MSHDYAPPPVGPVEWIAFDTENPKRRLCVPGEHRTWFAARKALETLPDAAWFRELPADRQKIEVAE